MAVRHLHLARLLQSGFAVRRARERAALHARVHQMIQRALLVKCFSFDGFCYRHALSDLFCCCDAFSIRYGVHSKSRGSHRFFTKFFCRDPGGMPKGFAPSCGGRGRKNNARPKSTDGRRSPARAGRCRAAAGAPFPGGRKLISFSLMREILTLLHFFCIGTVCARWYTKGRNQGARMRPESLCDQGGAGNGEQNSKTGTSPAAI